MNTYTRSAATPRKTSALLAGWQTLTAGMTPEQKFAVVEAAKEELNILAVMFAPIDTLRDL